MLGGKVKLPRPLPPDPADRKCMSGKMSGSVRVACWGGGPFNLSLLLLVFIYFVIFPL